MRAAGFFHYLKEEAPSHHDIMCCKKGRNYICVSNGNLRFVDTLNYISPQTLDSFIQNFKPESEDSPYLQYFDTFERKLKFPYEASN